MKGRDAWDERKFRRVLTQAGRIINCSFGVIGVRDKKTGEMKTVLLFSDDDHEQFAYAFEFKTSEEVYTLCHLMIELQKKIERKEL